MGLLLFLVSLLLLGLLVVPTADGADTTFEAAPSVGNFAGIIFFVELSVFYFQNLWNDETRIT
jgi:hypothetical protein